MQARSFYQANGCFFQGKILQSALGSLLVVGLALGVHGKPSLLHALMLGENLPYAPEAREGHYSQYDAQHIVVAPQAGSAKQYTCQQECPPALAAQMIFGLDDQGMKEPDGEK